MKDSMGTLWVYLSASPLLNLTITVTVFVLARWLYRKSGRRAWLNPVMTTILVLVAFLTVTDTPYPVYFEGAQFVHFLLGTATVALAIPLYRQFSLLKKNPLSILLAVLFGSMTAIISAIIIAKIGGLSQQTIVSLAPKSVTTPVAMGVAEQLGGLPSLTAVLVILTGILGASIGPYLLERFGITNPMAQGLAMGTTSHGIGTGRAVYMGEVVAAFSGLALGLNALITSFMLPLIWRLLSQLAT